MRLVNYQTLRICLYEIHTDCNPQKENKKANSKTPHDRDIIVSLVSDRPKLQQLEMNILGTAFAPSYPLFSRTLGFFIEFGM